ncbi:unnamed protein product [Mytilus edulis]|uniref:Uncharacterized protein n=1 Tax=Mytilus edulis TaxID=6550 RepID=A0A8S3TPL9_MYTED|nr:unnamed protein product [Mytilus edulis]
MLLNLGALALYIQTFYPFKLLNHLESHSLLKRLTRGEESETSASHLGIKWTLQSCLEDLDFADDICQLSHRHEDSQNQVTNLGNNCKTSRTVHKYKKTKSNRVNTKVRDAKVEDVNEFTYLGSVISTSGGTDEDIKSRKLKKSSTSQKLKFINQSGGAKHSEHQNKHQNKDLQLKYKIDTFLWIRNLETNS